MLRLFPGLLWVLSFWGLLQLPAGAFSQEWTKAERLSFRNTVNTIYLHTYDPGDPGLRFYPEILSEVRHVLNRKGYHVEEIYYDSSLSMDQETWHQKVFHSLKVNEAFLELKTLLYVDTLGKGSQVRRHYMITDDRGRRIADQQINLNSWNPDTVYAMQAQLRLYYCHEKQPETCVPVHENTVDQSPVDPISLIRLAFSGIPSSLVSQIPDEVRMKARDVYPPFEITVLGGYFFPSLMDIENTTMHSLGQALFQGGGSFGAQLGIGMLRGLDLTLSYHQQNPMVEIASPLYADSADFRFRIHYFLLGAEYHIPLSAWFSPFAGISAGAVTMNPVNQYYREVWYFAVNPTVGVRFYLLNWLGIRLQGELFYQIHAKEAPFFYSPSNIKIQEDAMTNMIQWGISTGLIVRL